MAMFLAGLEKFKRWGPPSVKSNPFTLEEVEFAKTMNSFEGDAVYEELVQVEKADQYLMEVWDEEDEILILEPAKSSFLCVIASAFAHPSTRILSTYL